MSLDLIVVRNRLIILGRRRTVQGRDIPEYNYIEPFVELYSIEVDVKNGKCPLGYVAIRLVNTIEQFCRTAIIDELKDIKTGQDKIELEVQFIDNLIRAVYSGTRSISKNEIIATSYPFLDAESIQNQWNSAFNKLDKYDCNKLFEIRHKAAHTIKDILDFDTTKYCKLVETIMQNILESKEIVHDFYKYKITALTKLGKNDAVRKCYDEASNYFQNRMCKNPQDPRVYFDWGMTLLHFKRYNEAVSRFDKMIENDPDNFMGYLIKVTTLEKFNPSAAIAYHDEIINLWHDDTEAYCNKGLALYEFQRYDEAVSCFDKAIELDPKHYDAHANKGESLQHLGNYNDAISCFKWCISLNPKDAFVHSGLGSSLKKIGEFTQSKEHLIKSLLEFANMKTLRTLHPIHLNYYFGVVWNELEIYSMALECFDKTLQLDQEYTEAWLGKGKTLLSMGIVAEAKKCFDRVLKYEPNNIDALSWK